MAFPASGTYNNESKTEGEIQTALEAQLAATKMLLGGGGSAGSVPVLTITSGVVTPAAPIFNVQPQSGVNDELTHVTLTNIQEGGLVLIALAPGNWEYVRFVHAASGAGQLDLAGFNTNLDMDSQNEAWLFIRRGDRLVLITRFYLGLALMRSKLDLAQGTVVSAHLADTANPHSVTAAQLDTRLPNRVEFTTAGSDTWEVPAGVEAVQVTIIGGGGGGGGGAGDAADGTDGGDGGGSEFASQDVGGDTSAVTGGGGGKKGLTAGPPGRGGAPLGQHGLSEANGGYGGNSSWGGGLAGEYGRGGGGGAGASGGGGGGGSAGEYRIQERLTVVAGDTVDITVGAGGAAGSGGSAGGGNGTAGLDGAVIVEY